MTTSSVKDWELDGDELTLDELYARINSFYQYANYAADEYLIFTRLVEAIGGLAQIRKIDDDEQMWKRVHSNLPKAIVWWLTLCGKVGVASVNELLAFKYPLVCPYCRSAPHSDRVGAEGEKSCNPNAASTGDPEWPELEDFRGKLQVELVSRGTRDLSPALKMALFGHGDEDYLDEFPTGMTLTEWQQVLERIYPPPGDQSDLRAALPKSLAHLLEEVGELAQAIQRYRTQPSEFASEAADVFAWLMQVHSLARRIVREQADSQGWLFESVVDKYDSCRRCGAGYLRDESAALLKIDQGERPAPPSCRCQASFPREVDPLDSLYAPIPGSESNHILRNEPPAWLNAVRGDAQDKLFYRSLKRPLDQSVSEPEETKVI